jgi:hypothetical protein
MKRIHALILVLALGIAVGAGTFAALRTTQLGSAATATNVDSTQISKQNRALARAETALRVELRRKPPAIAALPAAGLPSRATAAGMPSAGLQAAPPAATQTVIYHRPPPIVHVIHRPGGGEHEGDAAQGHGDGGGLDD